MVPEDLLPVARMSRDVAKSARLMQDHEARFIVDLYYSMQDRRKRSANQERALGATAEPNSVFSYFAAQDLVLEQQAKRVLDQYTSAHPMGQWCKGHVGIGPVIAAGLLAHINIAKCPTAGHIWRYAGLDSTVEWIGADKAKALVKEVREQHPDYPLDEIVAVCCQRVNRRVANYYESLERSERENSFSELTGWLARRPWNADLKVLCWKLGESFTKFSNHKDCFYGHYYAEKKAQEMANNENLQYAEQAAENSKRVGKETETYKWNMQGKLSPAHIHARAQRKAVKMFLSHLHEVWFEQHFKKPAPVPYALAHAGHVHRIPVPPLVATTEE